MFQSNTAMIT